MSYTAVVMGAETRFGLALCEDLLSRNCTVHAGHLGDAGGSLKSLQSTYPDRFHVIDVDPKSIASFEAAAEKVRSADDSVDLLISAIDHYETDWFGEGLDFNLIQHLYDVNALAPIRFIEAFLPLTTAGLKRLCFVTSAKGSIAMNAGDTDFGYSMAKVSVNRSVVIMSNNLMKDGYTFRLFVPATADTTESARIACDYFINALADEFRLRVTDVNGREWPF